MTEQDYTWLTLSVEQSSIDFGTDLTEWEVATFIFATLLGLVCANGLMKCYKDNDRIRAAAWVLVPFGGSCGVIGLDKLNLLEIFPDEVAPTFLIAFSFWIAIPAAIQYKNDIIKHLRRSRPKRPALDKSKFRRVTSQGR